MANTTTNAQNTGLDVDADASAAPSDDEVGTILARIKAARASATDPVDLQQYKDAQDEAGQLYKDQADRSQWLSLADKIGSSVAKIGAARQGLKAGVDLSHIDTGPGYDVTGAMDRASKDYATQLNKIRGDREDALKNQNQDYTLADKAFDSAAIAGRQNRIDKRQTDREAHSDKLRKTELDAANTRQQNQFDQANTLADNREKERQKSEADRDKRARDFESDKEERFNKSKDLKDLDGQEKDATVQLRARQQLFNNLMNDDSLGGKTRDKLQADYGKQAAAAGVDLSEIQGKLADQETTRPGWMGGKTKDEERKGKAAILSESLAETKNMLDAIKAQKEKRLRGAKPVIQDSGSGESDSAPSPPPPADGMVKLKGPSGQVSAPMTKEKAAAYLSKPGYSIVP
jgi:hypothetical protein